MVETLATDAEWHERYGHLPLAVFSKVPEAPPSLRASKYQCDAWKTTKPPAPAQEIKIRTHRVGQVIHSDICRPFPVEVLYHNRYMVTLIANYSRLTMARTIWNKSDAVVSLQELIAHFETLSSKRVQSIKCNPEFTGWLRKSGIDSKPTVPYCNQLQGKPRCPTKVEQI